MNDRFRLRLATQADQQPLTRLFAESYPVLLAPDYPPSVLERALPLMTRANPALLVSGSYYVMEPTIGGEPLAAGGWTVESPHRPELPGTGHIRHVVTHPKATRQGLAAAIIRRSFEEARAARLTRLVALSTLTAVPFYAAMGFARECEETIAMTSEVSFPAMRMVCSL